MSLTTHDLSFEGLDGLTGVDSLCLFIPEDQRPLNGAAGFVDWRLCGALSRVMLAGFFVGQAKDTLLLPSERKLPVDRIFAVGVGSGRAFTEEGLIEALGVAAQMLNRAKVQGVALELPGGTALDEQTRTRVLQERFIPAFKGTQVAILAEKSTARLLPGRPPGTP